MRDTHTVLVLQPDDVSENPGSPGMALGTSSLITSV